MCQVNRIFVECICETLFISEEESFSRCSFCNTQIPKTVIEELLIERLSKMVTAFILQDRRCVHCKQLATRTLSQYCECSNRFELVIPKTEFMDTLRTVRTISKRYNLTILESAVQWQIDCFSK